MQPLASVADQSGQPLFDVGMHVFKIERPREMAGADFISDLREADDSVDALLQLVELVKRQTMALHAHARVLQAASASDTPRTVRLEQDEPAPARDTSASTHLLFLPGAEAYGLDERDGGPPPVGTILAVGDREFVITKVARSPLPGDPRSCVYGIEQAMTDGRDR